METYGETLGRKFQASRRSGYHLTAETFGFASIAAQYLIWYSYQLIFVVCRVNLSVTNVDDRLQSLHQEVSKGLTTLDPSGTTIDKLADEIGNHFTSRPSLLANLVCNDIQRRRPSPILAADVNRCQSTPKLKLQVHLLPETWR